MVQRPRLNLLWNLVQTAPKFLLLTAIIVGLSATSVWAEQQFPYVAYVTKSDAYVRSGPGQRYYPTQQLSQGHAVEVYRHDEGRWCAVRPPEGSFSVVATHQVNQLGQGVAEISAEQTVTRVGSLLSPERSAIQVMLPRGERVKVLESSSATSRWLHIAAPAGEFRWIAAADLSPQPPIETTPPPQASTSWTQQSAIIPVAGQQELQPADEFSHLAKSPNVIQSNEAVAIPLSSAAPPLATTDVNAVEIIPGSPADLQVAQLQPQSAEQSTESVPTPVTGLMPATPSQATLSSPRIRFQGHASTQAPATPRVAELELRLSEIVVLTPSEWQFGQIKSEANSMLALADLPGERNRLRDLLQRVARFENIQQRYTSPNTATPVVATQAANLPTASLIATEPPREEFTGRTSDVLERVKHDLAAGVDLNPQSAGSGDAPRYDAVGILKPVVSKREQAPRFALVDDQGEVVSFVTPTPDLNLRPYLGQRIGVHGTRDYLQEFRRAHVAAGRITPIDGRMRR